MKPGASTTCPRSRAATACSGKPDRPTAATLPRKTMMRETLQLEAAELRFAGDDEEGRVSATSPYGRVDTYRTIIAPGAFRSAVGRRVPMLMGHDPDKILGSWEVEE